MHKYQCNNELKQEKTKKKKCESGSSCVTAFFFKYSSAVNCRNYFGS